MKDSELIILLVSVASFVVFGIITDSMGDKRGMRNGFWWGFFLGVIGIIVVSMKKKTTKLDTLKRAKERLDLELITQEEYNAIKETYKKEIG